MSGRVWYPPKMNQVKACVQETTGKVKLGNQLAAEFEIGLGLKRGDGLSPILLNILLEKVIREVSGTRPEGLCG